VEAKKINEKIQNGGGRYSSKKMGEVGTCRVLILVTGLSDTSNLGGGGICILSNGGRSHKYGLNSGGE